VKSCGKSLFLSISKHLAPARQLLVFMEPPDFFDAVYQYPGGWLSDHLGRRRAFLIFVALPRWGISYYLLSPSWPFLFVGLALVMAWQSMASPAIYPFMILAFVVGGLREIGGPARKTMMVGPVYCCRCHWHNRDVSLHRDS
jgi:MFS family permease